MLSQVIPEIDAEQDEGWSDNDAIEITAAKFEMRRRARHVLHSLDGNDDAAENTQKKQNRGKACMWLQKVNAMVVESSGKSLLWYSRPKVEDVLSPCTEDVWKLPCLTVVPDQGSDGVAALSWLKACDGGKTLTTEWWDPSHRGWRCVSGTAKHCGLWTTIVLLLIANSVNYKAYSMWYAVQKQVFELWLKHMNPETCPFLDRWLPDILEDFGWSSRISEEGIKAEVWEEMWNSPVLKGKGTSYSLVRWYLLVDSAVFNRKWTTVKRICFLVMSLMNNQFTRGCFANIKTQLDDLQDRYQSVANLDQGTMQASGDAVNAMKACCKNGLELATALYMDSDRMWHQKWIQ